MYRNLIIQTIVALINDTPVAKRVELSMELSRVIKNRDNMQDRRLWVLRHRIKGCSLNVMTPRDA